MNDNERKYCDAFIRALNIDKTIDFHLLKYRDYSWDSVAHMILMSTLEDSFDIQFETDDVIDFSSFEKGKEIMMKYGVTI